MSATVIHSASEIRRILEEACGNRELVILVTPYMRFESNFITLDADAFQVRVTMSAEEATYGLRSPQLHIRFPHQNRFLSGPTKMLGFGQLDGRKTLLLAIPKVIRDDEMRQAYRVERIGKVPVTFSTPRFDLKAGTLVNISTSGARIHSPVDDAVKQGDALDLAIPLTGNLFINHPGLVRWVQGRLLGVEFVPPLEKDLLTELARWVFQRAEEDKERLGAFVPYATPAGGKEPGMVLVSSAQDLEERLKELLTGLPPLTRAGMSVPAVKEAMAANPHLIFFHIPDASLDGRRRLKTLVEVTGGKIPFVLLGTHVDNSVLFDLGNEYKAAAVYDVGAKPGPFFLRLVQGILRRRQGEDAAKEG